MSALQPSRTKYRKAMKGSRAGNAKRGNTLAFGEFGLQSLSRGPMTGRRTRARERALQALLQGLVIQEHRIWLQRSSCRKVCQAGCSR